MDELIEVPDPLAAPARERSKRATPSTRTAAAPESDGGGTVAFTIATVSGHVERPVLARLLRTSLAHEATLHDVGQRLGLDVDQVVGLLERTTGDEAGGADSFTDSEARALAEAHVDVSGPPGGGVQAALSARAAAQRLVVEALSVEDAAALLKVSAGRVRQRLASGELVAVRGPGGSSVVPRWQIGDGRVVPALDVVLADVAPDVHPLTLARYMASPNPDLLLEDEPVSPAEWLLSGGQPEPVTELLRSLTLIG